MKIQFLGTGAADWKGVPPTFPGYRYFSSAIIDDVLLIDPGPDVFLSAEKFGISLDSLKWIINTHTHEDHYCFETVKKLTEKGVVFVDFGVVDEKQLGKYRIRSLEANHSTCQGSKHFMIEDGEKKLYYALDSSWLLYDEYLLLKDEGADLIVLDATIGDVPGDYRIFEHNNLNMVRELKKTLNPYIKRFIISHMALTLHEEHEKLAANMKADNIEVAKDGLIVTV